MRILMLGLNHRTAGVELRERVAFDADTLARLIVHIRTKHPHSESIVLSTCNRMEIFIARPAHEPPSFDELAQYLADHSGVQASALSGALIQRENSEAVAHLFRVAAGLDSMVLGEPQVLGQVKRAYETANALGAVGPVFHKVFQQAVAIAKQVRTETGIDSGRLSVGSVAVDFARRIFERFDDKTIVGIGAGEMAKLTLKHLQSLKPARLYLANRSADRALTLARKLKLPNAESAARPLEALDQLLVEADIVLTSTGSPTPILTPKQFHSILKKRRNRPLFIIDIAMPRDADPAVGELPNVYLYNLDDLQQVVSQTYEKRAEEVARCNRILDDAVRSCMSEVQHRDVGVLIKALRHRLHALGEAENERTAKRLASASTPEQRQAVLDEHTHRLINKVLHIPLSQLDQRQADAPLAFYAAALRRLFDLDETIAATASRPPLPPDAAQPARPDIAQPAEEKSPGAQIDETNRPLTR